MMKKEEPRKGFKGAEIKLENKAWAMTSPVCGTLNGWAKAWKAEPQEICKQFDWRRLLGD